MFENPHSDLPYGADPRDSRGLALVMQTSSGSRSQSPTAAPPVRPDPEPSSGGDDTGVDNPHACR
jgi:hypothetical protein